jgi:hypothetical protein
MPYITKARRRAISGDYGETPADAGELNFVITQKIAEYVYRHKLRYQTINDVVGALEGAKAEFQRRVVGPYEDTKIATNGDVYHESLLSRTDVRHPAV